MKHIAVPVVLNAAAAAAGVLGTILIVWHFGLATFGIYAVALAKLSLILLGSELVPSAYAQFRLQDDPDFAQATPTFFILFGLVAAGISAGLIAIGTIAGSSWFMPVYVFSMSIQRGLDSQILARGEVGTSVSIALVSNVVRVFFLVILMALPSLSAPDTLWLSLAAGAVAAQLSVLGRRPELVSQLLNSRPLQSMNYLWGLRKDYPAYYANSILKRLKDTLFPLFCDLTLPNKSDVGLILVYTRSLEAVAGQIRVLELFLIHRETRANLARERARILIGSAMLAHLGVILLSSVLLLDHGLTGSAILYAALIGLFLYPYVFELARRSDAYAALQPSKVTLSLAAYTAALAGSLGAAWVLDLLVPPVLIGCIVLAQAASALVYLTRDQQARQRLSSDARGRVTEQQSIEPDDRSQP